MLDGATIGPELPSIVGVTEASTDSPEEGTPVNALVGAAAGIPVGALEGLIVGGSDA